MGEITIGKEQQIVYRQTEKASVLPIRDWKRIKACLEKIHYPSVVWSNVGWASLGICISSFGSWISDLSNKIYPIIGFSMFCITICSLFAHKGEKKQYVETIDNLKDVIKEIDEEIINNNECMSK